MKRETEFNKELVKCFRCGSDDFLRVYPELSYVSRCAECGLVYSNPRMDEAAVRRFYSGEYFTNESSHMMGYDNYVSDEHLV